MTVPVFTQSQLIEYIKSHGWEVISDEYWEKYDRLIFGKDGKSITFQCQDKYFYIAVVKTCEICRAIAWQWFSIFLEKAFVSLVNLLMCILIVKF